ncbi:MAG: bifunctional UDP-N-acetylglucosamine diphosphorylase/glucosamine-1-phosphate N-acetyltransferase GlmU [Armatimonadetes bacterium]|nr:bifunctional UDP-N-acetylglucosamine diphosphorylase/glucosamine-1-phosphate N-acetyltransferase GlmU [Armatimonadota bacterium]
MTQRSPLAGLILAAGKGTRMRSELPKCLHKVCGVPMAEHVGRAMKAAGVERPVVVVGHEAEKMKEALGGAYSYALQAEQLGTGHAAASAAEALKGYDGPVLVTPGDTPLLSAETLAALAEAHREGTASVTMATCLVDDPEGYGRIVRKGDSVVGIVEHKDCTPEQLEINEINPAVYCFDCRLLYELLPSVGNENAQGEYYLTDVVAEIAKQGKKINALVYDDFTEFIGVNDRWQLTEAAWLMRLQILGGHAENGVTIMDPGGTHIDADVEIGGDVTVLPGCVIQGSSKIGAGSQIGPNCWIKDSEIGEGCKVFMSHLDCVTMGAGSRCGPFSNLRPGTRLGVGVKIGNFVEIKASDVADRARVSHLAYIGDASVGAGANIGAGTITCNYDGFAKHRTEIGADAFIGSNSTLIAPVKIGDGAVVGAGSVITDDVPEDALAIGRGRQETKEQWAKSWRKKKAAKR